MPELTTIPEARLSRLKAGLTRLAQEKLQLAQVALLMARMKEGQGSETVFAGLLRFLTESLGSQGATLYYRIDGTLFRHDLFGRQEIPGEIGDGLVRYVFETRETVSREFPCSRTGAKTPGIAGGVTRAIPLLAGTELVGVLRYDDPSAAGRREGDGVPPILPFASVVLSNGIAAETRDRRASGEASRPDCDPDEDVAGPAREEGELAQAKEELERRVDEHAAELGGILDGTASPVFSLDREYRYVAFNRSHASVMRTLFGAEIEVGYSLLDSMTVQRDRETAKKNLDRALAGETLLESGPSGDESGARKHFEVSHHPVLATDGSVIGVAVFVGDVTERRRAEEDRLAHLRFFESLDQVNRALQGTNDLEQMMSDVLDAVLAIFGCDRAWLVFPCDPESATYRVPMERTRPEYPGALARELEVPVDPETAAVLRALGGSSEPVTFGPGLAEPLPIALSERFHVQSQIAVAVYPKASRGYAFGLHQCSYLRTWTADDAKLLREIGRRLGDGLTSLLTYRDLEGSEERYRTLIQRIQAAVVVHGADTRVLASNRKAQELLGLSEDQLLGKAVADRDWQFFRADGSVVPPEEFPAHRVSATRQPVKDLVARIHRSGGNGSSDVWVLVNADPVLGRDGEISQVIVTFSDITELKRLEAEQARASRALRMLSDSNQALIRISDEKALLEEVCRIAVRVGGFCLAWVGIVEHDEGRTLRPVAQADLGPEAAGSAGDTWAEDGLGRVPADAAIRTGRPCLVHSILADPDLAPWHDTAARRGYGSLIALPLASEGRALGALVIYAGDEDAFDSREVAVLEELAGDLSFGVTAVRTRAKRDRAEGRLLREAERCSSLLDLFLSSPQLSERQVYDGVLELAVRLTGSTIGLLFLVSEDQETVRLSALHEVAPESCPPPFDVLCPIEEAGSWVDCVRAGVPVLHNDLSASHGQKAVLTGRVPLRRSLSVPVAEEGVVRIVFGVANKDVDFDEDDVFQVQQIAGELQKLIRQRHAVERVEFLGRLYRTVSEMNQVIVREKSRDRLLAEVCRIGVEHGGFAMVWAGLVDPTGGTVRPAGAAGLEAGYADDLEIRLDAPSAELRPAARAIVENRAVVVDDTETDPGFELWRDAAQKRNFRSCAAFPVRANGLVRGVLAVYAGEAGVFHGEVANLLGELAADLGFSLRALETDELRAEAEQALRAERGLFVGGPTVVFKWKAREGWPVEYVSPNVTQQFGYAPEDFTSGAVLYAGIVHPDDLERVGAEVSAFGVRGVSSFEQTYRVRRADGRYRWIHDFTTVLRGGDGTITHYQGYVLDVTERRRAEDALRDSEERYRLIAENTADTISVMDLDLRLTFVSPSVRKLRGYTVEEAMGQALEQVVTPASLPAVSRLLDEQIALETRGGADPSRSATLELEEYCKDGSTIWVEAVVSFLRDGALTPTGIVAVTRDVTKRKEADLRLAESEQKYRILAESSPDNIIRYDAEGRMVYVNANLERTVDFDFGSRVGTIPAEEPAFSVFQPYLAKLQEVIRSGQPAELEMDVASPAGGSRTHSIRFVPERSDDGRIVGALAFGRDITERKEAARERQRYLVQLRQNLEDAVAAIAATVEARDPYTAGHQKRVAALAAETARELGLDEETVQGIHLAGTIHDLGKIKIPAEILARPGGLSALETRLVRIHPEAGWEILKGVEFPWPIAEMVLQHHERMNGSGYPYGLRGEQISLGARILAVADVVEAVASHRPYRPARGLELALSDIERDPESCFDHAVVRACLSLFREKGFQFRD